MTQTVHYGWKTATIVLSIVALIIVIGATLLFNLGHNLMEDERQCVNQCVENDYKSYHYDTYADVCYCIDSYGSVVETYTDFSKTTG